MMQTLAQSDYPGRWWTMLPDGRIECRLCPRFCKLNDGQRGFCFVRQRIGDGRALTTYGGRGGFCVDPMKKKRRNHFLRGPTLLWSGQPESNPVCGFGRNWNTSKA